MRILYLILPVFLLLFHGSCKKKESAILSDNIQNILGTKLWHGTYHNVYYSAIDSPYHFVDTLFSEKDIQINITRIEDSTLYIQSVFYNNSYTYRYVFKHINSTPLQMVFEEQMSTPESYKRLTYDVPNDKMAYEEFYQNGYGDSSHLKLFTP